VALRVCCVVLEARWTRPKGDENARDILCSIHGTGKKANAEHEIRAAWMGGGRVWRDQRAQH